MNADRYCEKCEAVTARRADGYCKVCDALKAREYRKANREKVREKDAARWIVKPAEQKARAKETSRLWAERNKGKLSERNHERHLTNQEKFNARSALWAKNNPDRQKERTARYHAENPHKANHRSRVRRDKLSHSQPKWAKPDAIKAIYLQAAEFRAAGIDVEVDHFYPLQGEFVSGLHCEANLQIITSHENRSKQNRYIP